MDELPTYELGTFLELMTAEATSLVLLPAEVDGVACHVVATPLEKAGEYKALAMIIGQQRQVFRRAVDGTLHPLQNSSQPFCN